MHILVTGVAGFIGFHVARALLGRHDTVTGIDNVNDYYDPALKQARLNVLRPLPGFTFIKTDITDTPAIESLFKTNDFDAVIHLAAQPGVRYSLENPHAYIDTNIKGHLNISEGCRFGDSITHLVYASSSSVYGANTTMPFAANDKTDRPVSLYAATKKSNEVMTDCYSRLFQIPATGLRFFTVYGPWGRPDMATYAFTDCVLNDRPIRVFNHGRMKRDFTYIDDIVSGVIAALDRPPAPGDCGAAHEIYNLGNDKTETLHDFIAEIEKATGKTAEKIYEDMQPGDIVETRADITESRRHLNYDPQTPISQGIPEFVAWYKDYHDLKTGE